ncbi:hypothetical protein AB0I84_07470 [Streptomyces spectabilis]|uniref:hypothetical protein n=1 Tax=Streptomyces spectabilis TaxID=68270 RepID=UPI00340F927C
MTDIKTWADGEKITPAEMKKYVSDALRGFLEPPACRRTVANQASEQKSADTWHPVSFDKPGSGTGAGHSYDNTDGRMSDDPFKVRAPIAGLYEVSAGLVLRSASGSLTYAVASVNRNQSSGDAIGSTAFLRFGLGRATGVEKVGCGTATITLNAGQWVSMAFKAESPVLVGSGAYAQFLSHLEIRWVGVKP